MYSRLSTSYNKINKIDGKGRIERCHSAYFDFNGIDVKSREREHARYYLQFFDQQINGETEAKYKQRYEVWKIDFLFHLISPSEGSDYDSITSLSLYL